MAFSNSGYMAVAARSLCRSSTALQGLRDVARVTSGQRVLVIGAGGGVGSFAVQIAVAHGEMTQADLAERIGVTRQTVIAIEQGKYSPSLEVAFQIAHVLGVPLDDVFQYPDSSE